MDNIFDMYTKQREAKTRVKSLKDSVLRETCYVVQKRDWWGRMAALL